ncbi:hypothetical protein [Tautonia marina]|uniref:hypothetical protein n=1 Tax=Tautonia marina TaxID=2653855 RepID=UPI001260DCA9|nr:hypothetical protein [Tautonia marina]
MRWRASHAWGLAVLTVSALGAAAVLSAQAPESGPKLGEIVTPFDVYDVTGPNQGNELCYV